MAREINARSPKGLIQTGPPSSPHANDRDGAVRFGEVVARVYGAAVDTADVPAPYPGGTGQRHEVGIAAIEAFGRMLEGTGVTGSEAVHRIWTRMQGEQSS